MKVLLIIVGVLAVLFVVFIALLLQNITFKLKCKKTKFHWEIKYLFLYFDKNGVGFFKKPTKKKAKLKDEKEPKEPKETEESKKDEKKKDEFSVSELKTVLKERKLIFKTIGLIFRFLFDFLRDFRIYISDVEVWIGCDDPAMTGMTLGWLYSLGFVKTVYPDYFDLKFDISGEMTVKLRPFMFFWRVLQLFFRLPKIKLYKLYKSLKGGKNGQHSAKDPQHNSRRHEVDGEDRDNSRREV